MLEQFALAAGATKEGIESFNKNYLHQILLIISFVYLDLLTQKALVRYMHTNVKFLRLRKQKIKGLVEHYNISTLIKLEYFVVHKDADIEHREQSAMLMNQLSDEERILAEKLDMSTVKMLANFYLVFVISIISKIKRL